MILYLKVLPNHHRGSTCKSQNLNFDPNPGLKGEIQTVEVEGAIWNRAESKRSVSHESSETLEPPLRKEMWKKGPLPACSTRCSVPGVGAVDKTKSGMVCAVCLMTEQPQSQNLASSVFSLLSSLKCLGTSSALEALDAMLFGYPKMKLYLSSQPAVPASKGLRMKEPSYTVLF